MSILLLAGCLPVGALLRRTFGRRLRLGTLVGGPLLGIFALLVGLLLAGLPLSVSKPSGE